MPTKPGIPKSWVDTDTALTANSDSKIATQKAVKAYADAIGGGDVIGPAGATAGNLAALDATGKILSDSGAKPADFHTIATTAALATGMVKNTTGTGAKSIGVDGTDYLSPATGAPAGTPVNPSPEEVGGLDGLTGNIQVQFAGKADILVAIASMVNGQSVGMIYSRTVGENVALGDECYQGPDGKYWKALGDLPADWAADTVYAVGALVKSTAFAAGDPQVFFCSAIAGDAKSHATTEPTWAGMAVGDTVVDDQVTFTAIDINSLYPAAVATATIVADDDGNMMFAGVIRNTAWSYVKGQPIYSSPVTPGAVTQTCPRTSGNLMMVTGRAETADIRYFNPVGMQMQVS